MSKFDKVSHAGGPRFYSMPSLAGAGGEVAKAHGCFSFVRHDLAGRAVYEPMRDGWRKSSETSGLLGDLLGVNPYDADELEAFMGRYGLAYSLARVNVSDGEQPYYALPATYTAHQDLFMTRRIFQRRFGTNEAWGITGSVAMTKDLFDASDGPTPDGYEDASGLLSRHEAQEAVATVKAVCQTILDAVKVGGYPSADDLDAQEKLDLACQYASAALARHTFAIAPFDGTMPDSAPALSLALAQTVAIALDGEPLKQCKHCGRWFQYKTGARTYAVQDPSVQRRERRADYCSVKCQQAHNYEKLKAKRAAERAEREKAASNEKTAS